MITNALVLSYTEEIAKTGSKFLKLNILTQDLQPTTLYVWNNIEQIKNMQMQKVYSVNFSEDKFPALNAITPSDFPIEHFYVQEITLEDCEKYLRTFLESIDDLRLRDFISWILDDEIKQRLFTCIGGKFNHHTKPRSLIVHLWEVYIFVLSVMNAPMYSAHINHDVAKVGAFLHDIGKLWEYKVNLFGEVSYDFGLYTGSHCSTGAEFFAAELEKYLAMNTYTEEQEKRLRAQVDHIKHIIRAHHLQPEWGAASTPHSLEAYLVFLGDYFSARFDNYMKSHNSTVLGVHEGDGKSVFLNFKEHFGVNTGEE